MKAIVPTVCILAVAAAIPPPSTAQISQPTMKLNIGTPQTLVASAYGKPFEKWQLQASEHSAEVGVPTGLWQVYHLTAGDNRMYITMLHFAAKEDESDVLPRLDALMLELNGHWSVKQILDDQPEIAALCKTGCDVLRGKDSAGNAALVLRQKTSGQRPMLIFFEGDSAEKPEWRSVASMEGFPAWVYVLTSEDFNRHYSDEKLEPIGQWKP